MSKEIKNSEQKEENLVKKTCRELGITQKELAKILGVHDVTVRNWNSKLNTPKMAENFMNLLIEKKELSNYLNTVKNFVNLFDDLKGVRKFDTLQKYRNTTNNN
jgi:DNA-binding XRE family transcriptional regulator